MTTQHSAHTGAQQLHTTPSRRKLVNLFRQRPLTSFFVLANLLSWVTWTPYILSLNGVGAWGFRFPEILGTSQLLGVLPGAYIGPIGSAFLLTAVIDGRQGLKAWMGRLLRWRAAPIWYLIAVLAVPAGMVLTGLAFSAGNIIAPSVAVLAAYLPMLAFQFITTGLAEEPGWRDFALHRLQKVHSPLKSAFILGPLWTVWHLPLFLTEWGGYPDASWVRLAAFSVFCCSFNIVMSWVFNRTGESLPLSMLMHVSANNFASVMWSEIFPTLEGDGDLMWTAMAMGSTVAAILIVVTTKGRLGYHPVENAPGQDLR
ncbi:CPBP family intramembrane glutamic endopeptidase [Brevibacterium sediminis]|uniref:CPBP family intramembrane metalloprotease n=1 Tax=Brevibacterium sediminis TaxID=1857024 RepID=A0A5C4WUE8_9MICO|nr:CPBP family intramembrane glutamic endopeptidase [Brevibacterium sediminis]TNM51582.1 CPBP family intramembrane metalloprotease [Brevibacterium sediminis]